MPSGHYTPQLQAAMSRLGSKLSFAEAAEELNLSHHTAVPHSTLRDVTYRSGRAAEALAREEAERIEREAPSCEVAPQQLLLSTDGAFVPLVGGQWREVKSIAVGEFERFWDAQTWQPQVKSRNLSYFSRSYAIRDFERYALGELHRRGLENAQAVVAVNDGAEWIQSFLDYHAPDAVRIIDFAHAAQYVAAAGKAIWGEESEAFKGWYTAACHQLKHRPPRETLANMRLLQPKAKTDEQRGAIDQALFYLESRQAMLDYPHFQGCGYPIGSGSVESGHKQVVQCRMTGAGMRWAEAHVDPMLALRNLICNDRWAQGWQEIVAYQHQAARAKRRALARAKQPPPPEPLTFASLKAAGLLPEAEPAQPPAAAPAKPHRPAQDHPWRRGIWPTKEAWRWN